MANIGAMRERVTLQAGAQIADAGGGYVLSWVTKATVWARVKPLSGREVAARGGLEASQMYEVTIRARQDVEIIAGDRLVWRSRFHNVRTIKNFDERGAYLTLECESGVTT